MLHILLKNNKSHPRLVAGATIRIDMYLSTCIFAHNQLIIAIKEAISHKEFTYVCKFTRPSSSCEDLVLRLKHCVIIFKSHVTMVTSA